MHLCPHKHYRMKVHFRDLEQNRPSCPVCGAPMLVKEEKKMFRENNLNLNDIVEESSLIAYLV